MATASRFLINSQSSVAFAGRDCRRLDITQSSDQTRAHFYFDWTGVDVYSTADCSGTARAGSRYQGFVDSAAETNSARLRGGQASGTVTISGRGGQSGFDAATANFAAATISDLPSADDGPAGETYQRNFSVLGTNRAATVSGTGCSLVEDTALRVGTTRHYTLSATATEAGKVTCTITVGTVSQTATITFFVRPAAPRNLRCALATVSTITWEWDAVSGLAYQVRDAANGRWKAADRAGSHTVSGLAAGHRQKLWVQAFNSSRVRSASPAKVCAAIPRDWVSAACDADAKISVSWKAAPVAASYTATITKTGADAPSHTHTTPGKTRRTRRLSWTGEAGAQYSVAVQSTGGTAYSHTVPVTCPASGTLPAPTGLAVVCTADGQMDISWSVVASSTGRLRLATDTREFDVGIDGTVAKVVNYIPDASEMSYTHAAVVFEHAHRVRVRERFIDTSLSPDDQVKLSAWTAPVTRTCARPVPQNVRASCNSHGVVTVEWDAIRSRNVRYDVKADKALHNLPRKTADTSVHTQGSEGETYRLQARARTKAGWGPWSDPKENVEASVTCAGLDPAKPDDLKAGHPQWLSPNAKPGQGLSDAGLMINPPMFRVAGPNSPAGTDLSKGADSCGRTRRDRTNNRWTRTCTIRWSEVASIPLNADTANLFDHGKTPHGPLVHGYKGSDGNFHHTEHRHCQTNDTNKDGDITDPTDNDGTCPGKDTTVPDLLWHPPVPSLDDPFWQQVTEQGAVVVASSAAGRGIEKYATRFLRGSRTGSRAGWIGALAGGVLGLLIPGFFGGDDDTRYIPIAGHLGCLNPGNSNKNKKYTKFLTSNNVQFYKTEIATITETKNSHDYETKIEHIIYHCRPKN